jgi:RNA polymerase sigma factor (sigma-70 family)
VEKDTKGPSQQETGKSEMDHREDVRSDADLVKRALAGEERAFTVLVLRHFNAVYLTAYARLADRDAAEDLAQEVFLRAHLHLSDIADGSKFPHWVCRVSRNLALDWKRRSQTASRLLPLVSLDEGANQVADERSNAARDRLERRDRERAVQHAILELPADVREIVLLHYVEGLSEREIAARLGVNRTTVRYHLRRGLERFRTELSKWLPEAADTMRPNRVAAVRAAGIAAAAGAMTVSQKSALAAAAQATAMPLAQMTASATDVGGSILLKSTLSSMGAGAMALAKTKIGIAVAGVLAATLAAGGTYELASRPGGLLTPTIRIEKLTTPAAQSFGKGDPLSGRFELHAIPAHHLAAICTDMPFTRVVPKGVSLDQYNVTIQNMYGTEGALNKFLAQNLNQQLGLTMHREKISTAVLVMKNVGGGKPGLTPPTKDWGKDEAARIKSKGMDLRPVRDRLEMVLGVPVIDETGLKDKYTFDLRWHAKQPQSIISSLKKQLGIELVPAKRDIEFLVVEKGAQS